MVRLIELWHRDGDYKISINPDHIVSMRALTADEDDNIGTVITMSEGGTVVATNAYDDILKALDSED